MGFCKELREPVVLMKRENSKSQNLKEESTDARNWGGVTRNSEEAIVMIVERRGYIRRSNKYSTEKSGGDKRDDKTIQYSKAFSYASL